jgi:IS5 family transposase
MQSLDKENAADAMIDQAEKIKAGIRAKVENPFRVIKRQFGFIKVRYKSLKKHRPTHHAVCAVEMIKVLPKNSGS